MGFVCVFLCTGINLSDGCCSLKDQQQEEVHDGPPITPTHTLHLCETQKKQHEHLQLTVIDGSDNKGIKCYSKQFTLETHPFIFFILSNSGL